MIRWAVLSELLWRFFDMQIFSLKWKMIHYIMVCELELEYQYNKKYETKAKVQKN